MNPFPPSDRVLTDWGHCSECRFPPKAAVAGSPVTNRRSEPVSVVAAAPCQCRVAAAVLHWHADIRRSSRLVSRSCFPPARAIAHRLPANPEAGRRSPVLQLFSDGRQKQCRSENNQACPVRCHSAWSRIREVSVLIVCASHTVGRQRSEQVTKRRTAFYVEKSMDTHSNRCSVIYRPPGPTACRDQLAGDRPGFFRGQEDRDERDL